MIAIKLHTDCIYWFRIVTHKAFINASGTFWVYLPYKYKTMVQYKLLSHLFGLQGMGYSIYAQDRINTLLTITKEAFVMTENCRSWCGRMAKRGYIYVGLILRVGLYVGGYKQHLGPLNSFPPRDVALIWNAYNSERAFGSIYWVSREYYSAIFAGGLRCW